MKKILFVTSRNILYTCGELRLIKNRTQALFEEYGIKTDFVVLTHKRKGTEEEIGADSSKTVFLRNKYNILPFGSGWKSLIAEIDERLKQEDYGAVVLSGDFVLPVVAHLKKQYESIPVVADVHGAIEELIEFPSGGLAHRQFSRLCFVLLKYLEKRYLPLFDSFFVVSNSLEQYLLNQYRITGKCFIIPCAARNQRIDTAQLEQNRSMVRKWYGISDEEIVFVYSGGTSPWQCIEESVQLFQSIATGLAQKTRMLVLSGNRNYIRKFETDNIIIDSLDAKDVAVVLTASDYAFMLRQNMITNNVAYPNKFMEYVLAGLNVLATNHVGDVCEQIGEYEVGYILGEQFARADAELLDYIVANAGHRNWTKRENFILDTCFENRLRPFVEEYLL